MTGRPLGLCTVKAAELGVEVLAKVVSYASGGVDPAVMGTGPVPATLKALEKAGWGIEDLDLIALVGRDNVGVVVFVAIIVAPKHKNG